MTPPNVLGTANPASSVMMSRMLGASLGGTMRGAHHGFDCRASFLISPPNFAGGAGSCFPSMVVVALGEPGVPVICCAPAARAKTAPIARARTTKILFFFMPHFLPLFSVCAFHLFDDLFRFVIASKPLSLADEPVMGPGEQGYEVDIFEQALDVLGTPDVGGPNEPLLGRTRNKPRRSAWKKTPTSRSADSVYRSILK